MQSLPNLSELTHEQKDEMIVFLFGQVRLLTGRVNALEAQGKKSSKNSSKPPSSDGYKKTTSLRVATGKKPGGQAGRTGTTLMQVDKPDSVVRHELPAHCYRCRAPLEHHQAQIIKRGQVFDIPEVRFSVTEHQALGVHCACGKWHESALPAQVCEVAQYGPNIKAMGVHLTQGQLLPFARASEHLRDVYQLSISPGTLHTWVGEAASLVAQEVESIVQSIQGAPTVHADESGLRVEATL